MERRGRRSAQGAMIVLVILALSGGMRAVAQDETPVEEANVVPPHPVAIHEGTCLEPTAEAAYTIGDAGPPTTDDDETPTLDDVRGTPSGLGVDVASETIDVNLDDLLIEDRTYILMVHESAETYDTYIACSEIGGAVLDDTLLLGIRPLNNSEYSGVAVLKAAGDQTEVTAYLINLTGRLEATPVP
jgi:hypothetical protein